MALTSSEKRMYQALARKLRQDKVTITGNQLTIGKQTIALVPSQPVSRQQQNIF